MRPVDSAQKRAAGGDPAGKAQGSAAPYARLPLPHLRAILKFIAVDLGLKPREKSFHRSVVEHADASLGCVPSHETIMRDGGYKSVDTVERAQKDLEACGRIKVTRRRKKGGHRASSRYELRLRIREVGPNRLPVVSWIDDNLAGLPFDPAAPDDPDAEAFVDGANELTCTGNKNVTKSKCRNFAVASTKLGRAPSQPENGFDLCGRLYVWRSAPTSRRFSACGPCQGRSWAA